MLCYNRFGVAGPRRTLTSQYFRPPLVAGLAIVLVAGVAIGAIALFDDGDDGPAPALQSPTPAGDSAMFTVPVRSTANVRAEPDRRSRVVAILPGGREVEALGRTADGAWLRIAHPPGSSVRGWVRAESLALERATVDALPVLATSVVTPPTPEAPGTAETGPAAELLPDLMIADVFLFADGRLALAIRNVGAGSLIEREVPIYIASASGDILGVLRTDPTTLGPGGSATVVTSVIVTSTGNYRIEIDRPDEIRESEELNNSLSTLLVVGGG